MSVRFATLSLALFAASLVVLAQSFTGAITGVVNDPSAAAVPSARIVAIEERSNVSTETVAGLDGSYSFPALRPGLYRLEVEAAGFRKLVQSGIEVRVNDRLRLDLAMTLGAVNESVLVTGAAPLVESQTGAIGSVIRSLP
jgi:hypothetical protein